MFSNETCAPVLVVKTLRISCEFGIDNYLVHIDNAHDQHSQELLIWDIVYIAYGALQYLFIKRYRKCGIPLHMQMRQRTNTWIIDLASSNLKNPNDSGKSPVGRNQELHRKGIFPWSGCAIFIFIRWWSGKWQIKLHPHKGWSIVKWNVDQWGE